VICGCFWLEASDLSPQIIILTNEGGEIRMSKNQIDKTTTMSKKIKGMSRRSQPLIIPLVPHPYLGLASLWVLWAHWK
jgi:hypothetical protein